MKLNATSPRIEILLSLIQLILMFGFAYLFTRQYIDFFYFHWSAIACVILAFLWKNQGLKQAKINRTKIYGNIFLFQALLYLTFYGISPLFGTQNFTQTIHTNFTHLGLFPWGMMLVVAIGMGKIAYTRQKDCAASDLLLEILPIQPGTQAWTSLQLLIRQACFVAVILTLAAICFNIYRYLTGSFGYFTARGLLISLVFMVLFFIRPFQALLKKITTSRKTLWVLLPVFSIIVGLTLSLLSYWLQHLAHTQVKPPALLSLIPLHLNQQNMGMLFGQSWWFAWIILGGIYIARVSRGMSTREMILASTILPVVFSLLLQSHHINSVFFTKNWSIVFGILGALGLFKLIFSKTFLPTYILSYLPVKESKQRAHQLVFRKIFKVLMLVIILTMPIGLPVISLYMFLAATAVQILTPIMILGFLKITFKQG